MRNFIFELTNSLEITSKTLDELKRDITEEGILISFNWAETVRLLKENEEELCQLALEMSSMWELIELIEESGWRNTHYVDGSYEFYKSVAIEAWQMIENILTVKCGIISEEDDEAYPFQHLLDVFGDYLYWEVRHAYLVKKFHPVLTIEDGEYNVTADLVSAKVELETLYKGLKSTKDGEYNVTADLVSAKVELETLYKGLKSTKSVDEIMEKFVVHIAPCYTKGVTYALVSEIFGHKSIIIELPHEEFNRFGEMTESVREFFSNNC